MTALSGIGILVTRDAKQAPDLSNRLTAQGATVYEFPLLEIRHPADLTDLDRAIHALADYDWIVFASTNAVDFFFQRLTQLQVSPEQLRQCSLAAVGEKTAAQIKANGFHTAFAPQEFSGESFAKEFCSRFDASGAKFLWPRTNVGKLVIKEKLEEHGALVDAVVTYETHLPAEAIKNFGDLETLIKAGKIQMITLTSGQAAKHLHQLLESSASFSGATGAGSTSKAYPLTLATIGTETAKIAGSLFQWNIISSEAATIPDLARTILEVYA